MDPLRVGNVTSRSPARAPGAAPRPRASARKMAAHPAPHRPSATRARAPAPARALCRMETARASPGTGVAAACRRSVRRHVRATEPSAETPRRTSDAATPTSAHARSSSAENAACGSSKLSGAAANEARGRRATYPQVRRIRSSHPYVLRPVGARASRPRPSTDDPDDRRTTWTIDHRPKDSAAARCVVRGSVWVTRRARARARRT